MKRLQAIKEQLVSQVETQMTDLSCVDTEELGEVIDMIKDLAKAIYYCQVVSAMEEEPSKKKDYINGQPSSGNNETYLHKEWEGRSPIKRKTYMESKSSGQDKSKTIKELEGYMQDLTSDMMEMLDKATPEEKSVVQKKINTLAAKVQNV